MTVASPPWAIQASSHPATAVRQSIQGIFGSPFGSFAGGVSPTTARGGHGVIGATDLTVTANGTPNMTVNVAGGLAVIRGTEAAAQGCYGPGYNDASVSLAIAASDPANPRNDLIVLKVRDAQYSGASNDLSLAVITGTPAGSPADPSPPANSIVLARVRVDALAASIVAGKITDLRQRAWTVGGSGISTAALINSSPQQGDQWYVTDAALPTGSVQPATAVRPNAPGLYRFDQHWNPQWNFPWGFMDYKQITANSGAFSAETDVITGNGFTAVANRRLRVSVCIGGVLGSVAADIFDFRIKEGATQYRRRASNPMVGGGVQSDGFAMYVTLTPTAAAHTYKCTAARVAGTGTITVIAGVLDPGELVIEDIGPAGQPA